MQTLLFYDIEATGLSVFDQVVQFAGIRTDLDFNVIDQVAFDVRLTPDRVPSPSALCVHKIGIERLLAGQPLSQASVTMHQWLNTPGTQSGGYNTLGFDDAFLRFTFFQHLLPPYTHQYAQGCGRFDLYPMMVFFYLYKPEVLQWPSIDGRVSMKLEALARHNGLLQGQAHDALVDVEATIALARCLQKASSVWEYVWGFFNKAEDQARLNALPVINIAGTDYPLGFMIEGRLGFDRSFQAPVLGLGRHKHYRNQTLWLRLDDVQWHEFDGTEDLSAYVMRKKDGEPGFLLPMKARFSRLTAHRQERLDQALTQLQAHPSALEQLAYAMRDQTHPIEPNCDVEAALYQLPFPSQDTVQQMRVFHQASVADKVASLPHFPKPYQALIERYIWRYHFDDVDALSSQTLQDFIAQRHPQAQSQVIDQQGRVRLSVHEALLEARAMLADDLGDRPLLESLIYYLEHLAMVHPQWESCDVLVP